jgi:Ca2+-binding EF-hand superfamily protein
VDFAEFIMTIYVMSNGTAEQKLERTFRMYDVDDSGTVSIDEIVNVMVVSCRVSMIFKIYTVYQNYVAYRESAEAKNRPTDSGTLRKLINKNK